MSDSKKEPFPLISWVSAGAKGGITGYEGDGLIW